MLLALFVAQPFKAGDDQTATCQTIAAKLGRKPGAVDAQWRNVKYHLYRLDLYGVPDRHVGENVKAVVDKYRTDLKKLRTDARDTIRKHKLGLMRMI